MKFKIDYVEKPLGCSPNKVSTFEKSCGVVLCPEMKDWWLKSDGATVFFGFKELQFFSLEEIMGEDVYQLKKYLPNTIPICLDGSGNLCVGKVENERISGFFVVDCGCLDWEDAKWIAHSFENFLYHDKAPEKLLYS